MSNPFGTAALLLAENDPFEITFSPLSLILNWPKKKKKNQTVRQAEPLIIVYAGLSTSTVHSVNSNLLPLIPINIVGSKGQV